MPAASPATTVDAPKVAPDAPEIMRVLDTTAKPNAENLSGERTHAQLVNKYPQNFTFKPGQGLEMPKAIALKFLRFEGFILVDPENRPLPFDRAPKQPEDLGAGEHLKLTPHETIARFDELSNKALQDRAVVLVGGERLAASKDRDALVAFLTAAKASQAKPAAKSEIGADEYVPEVELDEVA